MSTQPSPSSPAGVVRPAFEDGLGRRYRPAARGDQAPPEILCFRPELTDVPAFEFSLRERVARLAEFRNPAYARIRKVDRLSDERGTVVLMSDCVAGTRLVDLLAAAEQNRAVLTLDAALCLVRQLIPAMTMLHREGGVAHGAIAPERLVVTPDAKLIVVEHVTGAALEQLRYTRERYWKELRVALPMSVGLPRFDEFADLTQLGVVTLSLILGRLLRDEEFPAAMGDLVNSAAARTADGGRESLPSGLRDWLRRALEVDARHSFKSLAEAQNSFDKLVSLDANGNFDGNGLQTFLENYQRPAPPPPVAKPSLVTAPPPPLPKPAPPPPRVEVPVRHVEPARHVEPVRHVEPICHIEAEASDDRHVEIPFRTTPPRSRPAVSKRAWVAAGVIGAMAAGGGLYAARLGSSPVAPSAPVTPATIPAVAQVSQFVEVPTTTTTPSLQAAADPIAPPAFSASEAAAPKIEPGWVSVNAPFDMELYEQGKLLGSTGIDRIMLPAGRHDIEVVSEALGYRETRTVNVTPNKVAGVSITLPKGTLSLNAIPWATVTIDGENAGDTPIGNLSLTIGPHDVVFTNPQLGEQRRVITVTQRAPVRFSIDLTKK